MLGRFQRLTFANNIIGNCPPTRKNWVPIAMSQIGRWHRSLGNGMVYDSRVDDYDVETMMYDLVIELGVKWGQV